MPADLKIDPLTIFVANESGGVTDTIKLGQNWSVYWTTHNRGDESAPAHTEVLTLSADDGSDYKDYRFAVRELAAGDAEVVTFHFGSSEPLSAGAWTALARLQEGAGGETHQNFTVED